MKHIRELTALQMWAIAILILSVAFSYTDYEAQTSQDIEVIRVEYAVQIVQSDITNLYYIECLDRCDDWYALADIAELYRGFSLACEAINYWKFLMTRHYFDPYFPLPCPPENA